MNSDCGQFTDGAQQTLTVSLVISSLWHTDWHTDIFSSWKKLASKPCSMHHLGKSPIPKPLTHKWFITSQTVDTWEYILSALRTIHYYPHCSKHHIAIILTIIVLILIRPSSERVKMILLMPSKFWKPVGFFSRVVLLVRTSKYEEYDERRSLDSNA